MSVLLDGLANEWKEGSEYDDVEAEYWTPGEEQVELCPEGCGLEIYEDTPKKWGRAPNRDVYRQTRICRKHGFARIYVITGPSALASHWSPQNA